MYLTYSKVHMVVVVVMRIVQRNTLQPKIFRITTKSKVNNVSFAAIYLSLSECWNDGFQGLVDATAFEAAAAAAAADAAMFANKIEPEVKDSQVCQMKRSRIISL